MDSTTLINRFISASGVMFVAALACSCADDDIFTPATSGDMIVLNATVGSGWQSGTLSASPTDGSKGARVRRGFRADCESTDDTLYIFETEDVAIDVPRTKRSRYGSRGIEVSDENLSSLGVYSFFAGSPASDCYMSNVPYARIKQNGPWHAQGAQYLWPLYDNDKNRLTFFAYAPFNLTDKDGNRLIDIEKDGANMKMHYSVPQGIDNQPDVLVTALTEVTGDGMKNACTQGVPLRLCHALSAVKFKYGAHSMYPGVVTNITLKNIVGEGVYDARSCTWDTSGATPKDYSFDCDTEVKEEQGDYKDTFVTTDGALIGGEKYAMMLMPQNSAERDGPEPVLEITFTDAATLTKRVFRKKLAINWEPGKAYTYIISRTNMHTHYVFEVDVEGGRVLNPLTGGVVKETLDDKRKIQACGNLKVGHPDSLPSVTVRSYYEVWHVDENGNMVSKERCPAQWKTHIAYHDSKTGNIIGEEDTLASFKSLWMMKGGSDLKKDRIEKVIPVRLDENVDSKILSGGSEEREKLNGNEYMGNGIIDLSACGVDNSMTTANCYIVSSPGTYRIPLVYGNAIKNGNKNEAAYKRSAGTDILSSFLRHDDRPITDPWIKNNFPDETFTAHIERFQSIAGHPYNKDNSGESKFVITGAGYGVDKNNEYLTFHINHVDGGIYPSNALISIRNSKNEIVWTWHIWITGLFIGETGMSDNYGGYKVLKHPLGELGESKIKFEKKTLCLLLTQTNEHDTGIKDIAIEFIQEEWTAQDYAQVMYYQFGRMVPQYAYLFRQFVNKDGNANIIPRHRTFQIAADSTKEEIEVVSHNSIGYVIRNPKKIFSSNNLVYDRNYVNLWNNGTGGNPIKTVYDPSPPGYMVPYTTDFWNYVVNGSPSFEKTPSYRFKAGGYVNLPRGAAITGYNSIGPVHNNRYTMFWTSGIESGHHHVVGYQFNTGADVINYPQLENAHIYTALNSLHAPWMLAILPMKEPD